MLSYSLCKATLIWEDIAFELEKTTYDVVEDNSHDYEVIAKVETNKIEPPPTDTGGFDLNQCPAYVPFPESCKRDENDLTDGAYATHETIT